MRPTPAAFTTPSPSSSPQFWRLNSPLPYLFGGLAVMLILIASALILLACSFRKRPLSDDEQKPAQTYAASAAADSTPKIVVIMAGEANPTHLAVPVPASKPVVALPAPAPESVSEV